VLACRGRRCDADALTIAAIDEYIRQWLKLSMVRMGYILSILEISSIMQQTKFKSRNKFLVC
jgi:hypothetical protein